MPSTHLEKTVALIQLRSDAESEYWLEVEFLRDHEVQQEPYVRNGSLAVGSGIENGKS